MMATVYEQLKRDWDFANITIPPDSIAMEYDIDFWIEISDSIKIGLRLQLLDNLCESLESIDWTAHDRFKEKYKGSVVLVAYESVKDQRKVLGQIMDAGQLYVDTKKEFNCLLHNYI